MQKLNSRCATESLFREHHEEITESLSKWSRDEQAASDAVQTAFLKALISGVLENMPEAAGKAWLYVTAKNALIDEKRKTARLLSFEDTEDEAISVDHDALDLMILESLLSVLDHEQRQIVQMRHIAGLTSAEIGCFLHLSPATVRTKLRSAMLKLRQEADKKRLENY
jgi:RNA polymerase sigma-70 factor (ECF subfamily)